MMRITPEKTLLLLIACGLFCATLFWFEDARPVVWSWREKNYEISAPEFSADNGKLVFVRKRHIPDGHEAELYSDQEMRHINEQLQGNERLAEPEIMLMNLADKSAFFVDYGWDPAFSRDQTKIVYARQKKPISRYRVLAATLAGNDICQYDLARRESAAMARPSSGYLSLPLPGDNGTVAFALSDAVNGAYGGYVGVGEADPANGKERVLYKPAKTHGLYHLVMKFAVRDGKCFVLRCRPLTTGTYMANSYAYELVEAVSGDVLYSWGAHAFVVGSAKQFADFRMCPPGLEIYDGGWQSLSADKKAIVHLPEPGVSSPDCARVAVIDKLTTTVTVFSRSGEPERRWRASQGEIRELTWSPDSSRLALVISHGTDWREKFRFDELLVISVNAMAAVQ